MSLTGMIGKLDGPQSDADRLREAIAKLPPGARDSVRRATEEGFLHGLNEILLFGGILCLVGTGFALWLVREREIDRGLDLDAPLEAEPVPAQ